jgi:hypothetical protein
MVWWRRLRHHLGPAARRHGLAVTLFAALPAVMTYPLITFLGRAVPGPPWDNLVWLYDTWWLRQAMFGKASLLFNPTIFYPFGYDLTLSETMIANKVFLAPLLLVFSPTVAYNLFLLLTFFLTSLATYAFVLYLTRSRAAGVVAALAFTYAPYRMGAMAAGWLPLIATQWLPLLFLFLERWVRERKARDAALAGLFLALNALSSWYYAYIVGLSAGVYLLWRLWPWRTNLKRRQTWANLALMALVTAVLVLPVMLPALSAGQDGLAWSLGDVEKWSASLEDFFYPNIYNPLWGNWFLQRRAEIPSYPWYSPGFVFVGFVPLALAWIGWRKRATRAVSGLALIALVAFVMALGTTLHIGGERFYIPVSEGVAALFARGMHFLTERLAINPVSYYSLQRPGAIPIPMPALLVYLFLPFGSAMRTLYRFGLINTFGVAVLAGFGVAALLRSGIRWRKLLAGGLAALVLLEFLVVPLPFGFADTQPGPLDEWLVRLPEDAVLMRFPLVAAWNGDALYRSALHGRKIAYGHGTFYPPEYMAQSEVLNRFPSSECISLLQQWGVTHVLVGERAYDEGWGDLEGQTWAVVQAGIQADGRLREVAVIQESPKWLGESVSGTIRGSLAVNPVLEDRVHIYELETR